MDGEINLFFNCQMGRGRTTTGMVTACLISTILSMNVDAEDLVFDSTLGDALDRPFDTLDGPREDDVYLQGVLGYKLFCGVYSPGYRRIQNNSPACWGTFSWENR